MMMRKHSSLQRRKRAELPQSQGGTKRDMPVLVGSMDKSNPVSTEMEERSAKRGKLTPEGSEPPTEGKSREYDANLCPFIDAPLDILLEVFGYVAPGDLFSLARTCWQLRRLLLSPNSTSIWKSACQRFGPVPECPEDMSEPRWASLFFCGDTCQECGAEDCKIVDFSLRRRVCKDCKRKNLVYAPGFKRTFPGLDVAILELIPYTNFGARTQEVVKRSRFYWRSDILDLSKSLDKYMKDVRKEKSGAKEALNKFKASRVERVTKILEHAERCREWNRLHYQCVHILTFSQLPRRH